MPSAALDNNAANCNSFSNVWLWQDCHAPAVRCSGCSQRCTSWRAPCAAAAPLFSANGAAAAHEVGGPEGAPY